MFRRSRSPLRSRSQDYRHVRSSSPDDRVGWRRDEPGYEDKSDKFEDHDDLVDYECDLTLEMNKERYIDLGLIKNRKYRE